MRIKIRSDHVIAFVVAFSTAVSLGLFLYLLPIALRIGVE